MSIRLMSAVFENETLGPTERLVLLALADHAGEDGSCYPSIERLRKRTGLSKRAVQSNVQKLESTGYLQVSKGGGRGHSSRYFIHINPAPNAPIRAEKGAAETPYLVHPSSVKGAPPAIKGAPPARKGAAGAPEPSRTIIEPSAAVRARPEDAAAEKGSNRSSKVDTVPQPDAVSGKPPDAVPKTAGAALQPDAVPKTAGAALQPDAVPDQTRRERLLAAMGLGPDGLAGPSSFVGTQIDMAEADRWAEMGISLDAQCAVIAERCAAMRRSDPDWMPRRFRYFSAAIGDLARVKSRPVERPRDDESAQIERWKRIASQ